MAARRTRFEPRLANLVARIVVQAQRDIALRQPLPQASQLYVDDGADLLAAKEWNTTISSTRLMNSGRKCWVTTCMTASFILA